MAKPTREELEWMRRGEIPISERVNSGMNDLIEHFTPVNSDKDMVTALMQSPLRRSLSMDERKGHPHAATKRETAVPPNLLGALDQPDYVVTVPIHATLPGNEPGEEGVTYSWNYQTNIIGIGIRRVFYPADQRVELDIQRTLTYLSAFEGSSRYDRVFEELNREVEDSDNQILMQVMAYRIDEGLSMIDGDSRFVPRSIK
jgi:hypothetical protein